MGELVDLADLKEYPVVRVVWYDAESSDDWQDVEGINRTVRPIRTVGYLIEETDDHIVVAQNHDPHNGKISMIMTIPNVWIDIFEEL